MRIGSVQLASLLNDAIVEYHKKMGGMYPLLPKSRVLKDAVVEQIMERVDRERVIPVLHIVVSETRRPDNSVETYVEGVYSSKEKAEEAIGVFGGRQPAFYDTIQMGLDIIEQEVEVG